MLGQTILTTDQDDDVLTVLTKLHGRKKNLYMLIYGHCSGEWNLICSIAKFLQWTFTRTTKEIVSWIFYSRCIEEWHFLWKWFFSLVQLQWTFYQNNTGNRILNFLWSMYWRITPFIGEKDLFSPSYIGLFFKLGNVSRIFYGRCTGERSPLMT